MQDNKWMIAEINRLKQEKNAVILAHNYQIPEIQDIADYVGDSLGLSQIAGKTEADMIVFCGVHFMAETASIISPDKKVIIPDLDAGCSLAESITAEQLREWKKEHPDAYVVSYVNTSADVKAECDYCCTSSNAVKVIEAIPEDKEILFLPDQFLGRYIQAVTGRKLNIWSGGCHVHQKIGDISLSGAQKEYPNAEALIHPECGCSTNCMLNSTIYDECGDVHIYSTEGMINHVNKSESDEFVIATEVGILHKLHKQNPEKQFHPASEESVCEYMKMITLEKLYNSLKNDEFEVKVPDDLAEKAKKPIERMLRIV